MAEVFTFLKIFVALLQIIYFSKKILGKPKNEDDKKTNKD